MTKFIGIDVGITGAIGIIKEDGSIDVFDMPIIEKIGKKKKKVYDVNGIFDLLSCHKDNSIITIEELHAQPTGTVANFSMGAGWGIFSMAIKSLNIPHVVVLPGRWKKKMDISSDKSQSRLRVIELFPSAKNYVKLVKDHNRAEALLLAEYGRRLYRD